MQFLSVGELSARSGVSVSALHFYETKGLIMSFRTSGNQRRYHRGVLRRVGLIQFGQSLGFSLAEIGSAFESFPLDRSPNEKEQAQMTSQWRAMLERRIHALKRLRDRLDDCIGCGCLSTEHCPLRNPHDRLAKRGSGPRRLIEGQ
jgi:MerR family transcriptional regulator, redox-sensitive transcriptional activator SoxR